MNKLSSDSTIIKNDLTQIRVPGPTHSLNMLMATGQSSSGQRYSVPAVMRRDRPPREVISPHLTSSKKSVLGLTGPMKTFVQSIYYVPYIHTNAVPWGSQGPCLARWPTCELHCSREAGKLYCFVLGTAMY